VIADVAILIVGFRNSADVKGCLTALSRASATPTFDVFICENGGTQAYQRLLDDLLDAHGPCQRADGHAASSASFADVQRLRFRDRASSVWVGCATDNLGYAGGINAWLPQLSSLPGWKGIWILNPDTEPDALALAALVECAEAGRKGMVGSTILDTETDEIRCRGGLHWQRFSTRTIAIGLGQRSEFPFDPSAIEAAMDSPSGASMYVTKQCLEKVGPMDESYFLFFEDLDWGVRAKGCGLGYASKSIVRHARGTTTGTAKSAATIPQFSVYLEHRNGIRFVRKHFPWTLPVRIAVSLLYAVRFLLGGAPNNFRATIAGVFAGLRGEAGRPRKYLELVKHN